MVVEVEQSFIIALIATVTRLGIFMASVPQLAFSLAPRQVRVAAVLILSTVFCILIPPPVIDRAVPLVVFGEFLLGLTLGLTVRMIFLAANFAGELIASQMALSFAQMTDPLTQEQDGVLARLFGLTLGAVLFATGAYLGIFRALAETFVIHPVGRFDPFAFGLGAAARSLSSMFSVGLGMALPLLLIAFATQVTFGLMSRLAPQLNAWSIGFLTTIGVMLVVLPIFVPTLVSDLGMLIERGTEQLQNTVLGYG